MNKKYTVTDADPNYISDTTDIPEPTLSDADGSVGVGRDPSDPLGIPGKQTPNRNVAEDQENMEKLVLEGVEQAENELHRAARRIHS